MTIALFRSLESKILLPSFTSLTSLDFFFQKVYTPQDVVRGDLSVQIGHL